MNALAVNSRAVLLWQVVGEFLQQVRNWRDRGRLTAQEATDYFDRYRSLFRLQLPTPMVIDRALDLASRYSLSHWDSLLLGACEAAGVTELHTEDMGSPRTVGSVQLLNPLV